MRSQLINVVITDEECARELLARDDSQSAEKVRHGRGLRAATPARP